MTKINYFVATVIGNGILGRLVEDFRAVLLLKVVGVAQVEEPGLRPIILPL
jgi:hypothetical protein